MATKKALIEQGGIFKKGRVMVTTVLKNGEDGESKVYTVMGKVRVSEMGGRYILAFTSLSGGSMGVTSKGTVSGRSHTRNQNIAVDSYEFVEKD